MLEMKSDHGPALIQPTAQAQRAPKASCTIDTTGPLGAGFATHQAHSSTTLPVATMRRKARRLLTEVEWSVKHKHRAKSPRSPKPPRSCPMGTSWAVRASNSLTWRSSVAAAMRLPCTSNPAWIAGSRQVGKFT